VPTVYTLLARREREAPVAVAQGAAS